MGSQRGIGRLAASVRAPGRPVGGRRGTLQAHAPTPVRPCPCARRLPALADTPRAQPAAPDWTALEAETLKHFQAIIQLDTSNPPGNESRAVDYLKQVLKARASRRGVRQGSGPAQPGRAHQGNGKKRPLLVMGHTDVVNVDPKKWTLPPFSATRDGGYVYGRGTVDDKDNLVAALMMMLLLKRAERAARPRRDLAGRVRRRRRAGGRHPVHGRRALRRRSTPSSAWPRAAACTRTGGEVKLRHGRRPREDPARRSSSRHAASAGHGSVPLRTTPSRTWRRRSARSATWKPPLRLNETTARVLQAAGGDRRRRDAEALPRRAQPRSEGAGRGGRVLARERAAPLVDAAHVARRRRSSPAASATT